MSEEGSSPRSKITLTSLAKAKKQGRKVTMLSAYDAAFARLFDQAGIEILLVGDSLGMVIQGHKNTLPVTLDDLVYHCRAVVRGSSFAHVVADMPFMTYQASIEEGLRSAGRLVKDGGAEAVKLEGGQERAELVSRLVGAGIPVMGHIGLLPQSVHLMGGFKVQGRTASQAARIRQDARSLAQAGAYALVLEGIPATLAAEITAEAEIPTIGIGAGPHCDGQVLVGHDMLGMDDSFRPTFVKRYAELGRQIRAACQSYIDDVRSGKFPAPEHSFSSDAQARRAMTLLK